MSQLVSCEFEEVYNDLLFIGLSSRSFSRLHPCLLQCLSPLQLLNKISPFGNMYNLSCCIIAHISPSSLYFLHHILSCGYTIQSCVICECDVGIVIQQMDSEMDVS